MLISSESTITIMRHKSHKPRAILDAMTPKRILRFLLRIDDSGGPFACWPCAGAPGPFGYRLVQGCDDYMGFNFTAHRVAWALHNGREPAADILHSCDNPPCCNWRHLREGTALDNHRDMVERGRMASTKGKRWLARRNRGAPVAAWQARYVERRPIAAIAASLGVHRSTVMRWLTQMAPEAARRKA
jgi:HNH endonuclease